MSELDLGKIKFTWKGTYTGATSYEKDDIVGYNGSSWICVNNVTNVTPSAANNLYWEKIAQGSDLGSLANLAAGSMVYFDGSEFVNLGVGSDGQYLKVSGGTPTWVTYQPAVIQENFYADRLSRTTGNGGVYYFGMGNSYDLNIEITDPNNVVHVSVTYFGETNTHDTHTALQYSVDDAVTWNNAKLGIYGQQGSMKVGAYPDSDYNSTPHTHHFEHADLGTAYRSDAGRICFRMYHFNGGTFYHNRSINSVYESGTSLFVVREVKTDRMYWN